MENQFNTDKQLRNTLRDFEAIPDSGSFDAILEKMNRKKKRRLFIIFFWTGLIALSGIAVPLLFNFHGPEQPSAAGTAGTPAPLPTPALHKSLMSTSSDEKASSAETATPETVTDPTSPHTRPPGESMTVSSSPSVKHRPEHQQGKPNIAGTGTDSGSDHKTHSLTAPLASAGSNAFKGREADATACDVIYMTPIPIRVPEDAIVQDLSASLTEGDYPAVFISPEKKTSFSFYLGAQASPQLNSFSLSRNPNMDQAYSTSAQNFPAFYLDAKKNQSQLRFGLPFGIKAGFQINKRYEAFAGFGYQSFTGQEKLYATGPSSNTATVDPGIPYSAAGFPMTYKSQFRYLYYSLEANYLLRTHRAIAFKAGLGLHGNQLLNSNYGFVVPPNRYEQTVRGRESLSPWLLTTKVKAGVIFNANRRFQLHISPGFFYSPTSVFRKTYVIRQKPYGFDVECLMLFRLFSR